MWEKIFTPEFVPFAVKVSGETEDIGTLNMFIRHVKERVDYKHVVLLAVQWNGLEDTRQANLAVHFAGMHHASRFIMLMDFLSAKFKDGELK